MSTEPDDRLSSPAADVSTDGSSCASTFMPDSRTACADLLPDAATQRECRAFGGAFKVHTGSFSGLMILRPGSLTLQPWRTMELKYMLSDNLCGDSSL